MHDPADSTGTTGLGGSGGVDAARSRERAGRDGCGGPYGCGGRDGCGTGRGDPRAGAGLDRRSVRSVRTVRTVSFACGVLEGAR